MKRKRHRALLHRWTCTALAVGLLIGHGLFMPQALTVATAAPVESSEVAVPDYESVQVRLTHEEPKVALTNPYEDPTQCTYRAWELAAGAGHPLPRFYDACNWAQAAREHGLTVVDRVGPEIVHGIAIWDSCAAGASWAGHVGYVTQVDGNRFYVLERNWVTAADTERWVDWEEGISFIVLEPPAPPKPAATSASTTRPRLEVDEMVLSKVDALTPVAPWSTTSHLTSPAGYLLPSESAQLFLTASDTRD